MHMDMYIGLKAVRCMDDWTKKEKPAELNAAGRFAF